MPPLFEVLCLTSNRYLHTLPAFAHCWQRFWPAQLVTVGHYDATPPADALPPDWPRLYLGRQDDLQWSAGALAALDHLSAPLVLLTLEDYWLCAPVDTGAVERAALHMLDRPDVGKIDLSGDRLRFPHSWDGHSAYVSVQTEGLEGKAIYLMSYQMALWRTGVLREYLRADEDIWQSERQGTERLRGTHWQLLGAKVPPLSYVQALKAQKPMLLRTERFGPAFLAELQAAGVLTPWGM